MKKSLFALAAVGAFTGAAQAQSSVTVYGILDVGMVGYNTRSANPVANTTIPSGVVNGTGMTFGSNAESTSRLGFRGTEDLGGGTRAFFTVELGVTPMQAQAINSGATQNRQTFLGLAQKGLGQFSIGTQYTTIHDAAAATDPGQLNNMMGNLIYSNGVGATAGGTFQSAATGSSLHAAEGAGVSYTIRQTNMLKLNTENIAGFKGNAFYVMNNTNSSQSTVAAGGYAGGVNNQSGWGLGIDFSGLPKTLVTANYTQFVSKNPYTSGAIVSGAATATTSTTGGAVLVSYPSIGTALMAGAGQGSSLGINVVDTQQYYAATYDFGILKAYAQYINRKVMNENYTNNFMTRTAQQIGVRGNITSKIEGWASGGTGKYNGYGSGGVSQNLTGFQVGSNYWLSKRTNLYVIYGQYSVSNAGTAVTSTSSYQYNGTATAQTGNANSYNANNYAVGVRHTF